MSEDESEVEEVVAAAAAVKELLGEGWRTKRSWRSSSKEELSKGCTRRRRRPPRPLRRRETATPSRQLPPLPPPAGLGAEGAGSDLVAGLV